MTKQHQQPETGKVGKEELTSQQRTMQEKEDKLYSIDGDDAQDGVLLSSPQPLPLQPTPVLRRGGDISYMPTTQPGAVHVPGIPRLLNGDEEQQAQEETYPSTLDPTPLVNAELVVPPPDHDNSAPVIPSAFDTTTVTMNHIPAEIFDATPIRHHKEYAGDDGMSNPPRLSELFKNTTVRVMMFLVLCLVVGLIAGLVTGLSTGFSRQVVIEVDDMEGEAPPVFQPTSIPTIAIDGAVGGDVALVEPVSSETNAVDGSKKEEDEFTSVPSNDNSEMNEKEEEVGVTQSNSDTHDEDDIFLGNDNTDD